MARGDARTRLGVWDAESLLARRSSAVVTSGAPVVRFDPVELAADGLRLRPWRRSDVPSLRRAFDDPQTAHWTGLPAPFTAEVAEGYVTGTEADWAAGSGAHFAVLDVDGPVVLGGVSLLRLVPPHRTAEIAYVCAPWARGRGVTGRAVDVVSRWSFEAVGLRRITWLAAVGNHASRRVAERCGFVYEGVARGRVALGDGTQVDAWQAGLLPQDLDDRTEPRTWPV